MSIHHAQQHVQTNNTTVASMMYARGCHVTQTVVYKALQGIAGPYKVKQGPKFKAVCYIARPLKA